MTASSFLEAQPVIRKCGCRFLVKRGLQVFFSMIVLLVVGGFAFETVMRAGDATRYPPPGRIVEVDGHPMHLYCTGAGSPTIILETGAAGYSMNWVSVQPALSRLTRVCSYDRAGYGWSEPRPEARTVWQISHELHALLANSGERGPYVLVGASNGGLYARGFALEYPDEAAGLVLVDATYEGELDQLRGAPALIELFKVMGRLGIFRLFPDMIYPGNDYPPELKQQLAVFRSRASELDTYNREWAGLQAPDDLRELRARFAANGDLGTRPLVVLVAVQGEHDDPNWDAPQWAVAALSRNSRYVLVAGGHGIASEQPQVVIDAVDDVVESVRTGKLLAK
jgi:pimeloyl-ACP methyl ester carboxylesterase